MELQSDFQDSLERRDIDTMLKHIPYAQLIGMTLDSVQNDQPIFRLDHHDDNVGNPILPAIHGGIIGGFMELSAALHLIASMNELAMPKIIDFSLDYLRAGRCQTTYASCQVWRQGTRVANVAINAWQDDEKKSIATARAHFLLHSKSE